MIELPICECRGPIRENGKYECKSTRLIAPAGVSAEYCRTCGRHEDCRPGERRPATVPPQRGVRISVPPPDETEKAEYPGVVELGFRFLSEWRAWRKAGKPVVTDAVRQQRRETCLGCDKYDPKQDRCTKCGCYLHRIKVGGIIDADALAWATKACPLGKWPAQVDSGNAA